MYFQQIMKYLCRKKKNVVMNINICYQFGVKFCNKPGLLI